VNAFRAALVVAIVALVGWTILHHGAKWKTYHDARDGWSVEMPASFHALEMPGGGAVLTKTKQLQPYEFSVIAQPGTVDQPDTQFPLDPVDFHRVAREVDGGVVRKLQVVWRHRLFNVGAQYHPSDEAQVFRMLRSLRFG
jgi:hypothetical protein